MVIRDILRPFGIFYGHLVMLWLFGIFYTVWVYCVQKNLATMVGKLVYLQTAELEPFLQKSFKKEFLA
jgi:hypothetical protein